MEAARYKLDKYLRSVAMDLDDNLSVNAGAGYCPVTNSYYIKMCDDYEKSDKKWVENNYPNFDIKIVPASELLTEYQLGSWW